MWAGTRLHASAPVSPAVLLDKDPGKKRSVHQTIPGEPHGLGRGSDPAVPAPALECTSVPAGGKRLLLLSILILYFPLSLLPHTLY